MAYKQIPVVLSGYTILLVDDEPDNLLVAQILLEMAGAAIVSASNGKDALKCLEDSPPSFIITDLSMPVMDGWTLLSNVRADEKFKDMVCFALTAHAMQHDRERVYEAGFNGYLTKPIDPATFVDDIVEQLRKFPPFTAEFAARMGKENASDTQPSPVGG